LPGQTDVGDNVISGGILAIDNGGTAIATFIESGGVVFDFGLASASLIFDGSFQTVFANPGFTAIDIATTIFSGGTETVQSGGTAIGTTISSGGKEFVQAGGTAIDWNVNGGGTAILMSGATALFINAASKGQFQALGGSVVIREILSGSTVTGLTISAETEEVFGVDISATILSGGTQEIFSGGSALTAMVSRGGKQIVLAGGTAIGATVISGGTQQVTLGGNATGTVVKSGGTEVVLSGGTAIDWTVSNGGTAVLSSGATAIFINSASEGQFQALGGSVVIREILSGSTVTGLTISAETEEVFGVDISATILSGGTQEIFSGGSALTATVRRRTNSPCRRHGDRRDRRLRRYAGGHARR
jgi:autotransporter passenger strand-loop-strand repeat protein